MESVDLDLSQVKNPIETISAMDDAGRLRLGFKLQPEDYETLRALKGSPQWVLYKGLLIKAKDEFFNSTLAIDEPNRVMKQMGMVAGINYAINCLTVLVHEYEKKQQKALAYQEKASKPS